MKIGNIWISLDMLLTIQQPENGDKETCGVIVGRQLSRGRVVVRGIVAMPNRHQDSAGHFRITKTDVRAAMPFCGSIVGVAHTHSPGLPETPSEPDLDGLSGRQIGIVWATETNRVTFYNRFAITNTIIWS